MRDNEEKEGRGKRKEERGVRGILRLDKVVSCGDVLVFQESDFISGPVAPRKRGKEERCLGTVP